MTQAKPSSDDSGRGASLSAPTISLPKGGGAIRGIGEKFTANPVTGTGGMSVPIAVSPARSGFGPQLSLSYDSGSGNGPFGLGWGLGLPAISRKTEKGLPQYRDDEESDVYIISGAEDLVPVLNPDGTRFEVIPPVPGYRIHHYRPRVEGAFARIERWTDDQTGIIHWRAMTRDNITSVYGRDADSCIVDPNDPQRIYKWLISESYDDKGNAIVYEYAKEDSGGLDTTPMHERNRSAADRNVNRYIKRIRYGNTVSRLVQPDLAHMTWLFEVVFDYDERHYHDIPPDAAIPAAEQHALVRAASDPDPNASWAVRPDPFSFYRAGFEIRTYRRCRRVMMFHTFTELGPDPYLVRSLDIDYDDLDYSQPVGVDAELDHPGSTRFASCIRSITQSGYTRDGGHPVEAVSGVNYLTYVKKSLPPLEFIYSCPSLHEAVHEVDGESLENLPHGPDGSDYRWVDLDGEGISGILSEESQTWYYKPNLGGGRFGAVEAVATKPPGATLRGERQRLLDLAGDGSLDIADFDGPTPGFFERVPGRDWEKFVPFVSLPNINWNDPNLRFVDMNGDGHADVLITTEDAFTWYPSLAEAGFGPARRIPASIDEERGPRLVFDDGTQSVYLADMSGDGLTDLVRIRVDEVCYWPNLGFGYGRFGAKITMDNRPVFDNPDRFHQRRILLADIDGSGTTDIIYLDGSGARIYFNQSGSRWSDARPLTQFPRIDDLSTVTATDLMGAGTACLVWSSPLPADARQPMRYLDLMGGKKPHLLVTFKNNLGAETHVSYAPSTAFYLADKAAGTPWITRLPFPVYVLEKVENIDHISRNRFVTRYAYHHGYFDGFEREFRGFGMVEQWDTEQYAAMSGGDNLPAGDNLDAALHVPPVLTKTWFHTGAYLDGREISRRYIGEYFGAPEVTDPQFDQKWREFEATLVPDTVLPPNLTTAEAREACRALKGSILRQEVYALDGTDKAARPYTVSERNYSLRRLQSRAANAHAVFLTHSRETLDYHYERNLDDPRISHTATLAVDDYGNVVRSVAVAYGRRNPELTEPRDRIKQTACMITCSESDTTNPIMESDAHRTPLPCDTRSYELTGLTPPPDGTRFGFAALDAAVTAAEAIAYDKSPEAGKLQKRLIEQVRVLYLRNNLTGPLPLGHIESRALTYRSYKLAFTPDMVAGIYGGRVSDAQMAGEGGYVHSEGDSNWWIPSGSVSYSPDESDPAYVELAYARDHFFLPCRVSDPFGNTTRVTYDDYDLMVREIRDPLGNLTIVGERDQAGVLTVKGHDYRVLQPYLVMDANRNRSAVAFDAFGMVVGTAVMGKPEENLGDSLAGFVPDLTEAQITDHINQPFAAPHAMLGAASTRLVYDLGAYRRTRNDATPQPTVVYGVLRETHQSDLGGNHQSRIQHSFTYSDGFGREIQKKIQAEAGPLQEGGPAVAHRWVGSGWIIYNNKGKPVRHYEPFFSDTHRFEFARIVGVSAVLFYDPVERVVATLHPNDTYEKVVFDPWKQKVYDVNDTVLSDPGADSDISGFTAAYLATLAARPGGWQTWYAARSGGALGVQEQAAADKAAVHRDTPAETHFDTLGRPFLTIAHNRFKRRSMSPGAAPIEEDYLTRIELDIEGNQRKITDAKDRVVMCFDYNMLGDRVYQSGMDAGERWTLNDIGGKPACEWDSRGARFRTEYDELRRPRCYYVRGVDSQQPTVEIMYQGIIYGDGPDTGLTDAQRLQANLFGKPYRNFDGAGEVTNAAYDFKGNLLHSTRRLARTYNDYIDWSPTAPPPVMEAEVYGNRARYDAFNRPIQMIVPHSDQPGTGINTLQPTYNEANLLDKVDVWLEQNAEPNDVLDPAGADEHIVTNIDYDAKGQRQRIDYGNGVSSRYTYDPLTFRLVHLLTQRDAAAFPDDCPAAPQPGWAGCEVQNLTYTYDPAGNITHLMDAAQQTVYFRNKRVEPSAEYVYDALYQLIDAGGREHLGQIQGQPGKPMPPDASNQFHARLDHRGDGDAMGTYLEEYVYDAVGNIESMQHRGSDPAHPGWTRTYTYDKASLLETSRFGNRLGSTTVGGTTEPYDYDSDAGRHGNITSMPHLSLMKWNSFDQLQATARQVVTNGGTTETTWYVYDASGQRVRKVTENANGSVKDERIYLGGFEIYRRHGVNPIVRETLHVMDDARRIALIETRTEGTDPAPRQIVRYQHGNHLESAALELDSQGQVISYEEYFPYGSTSYQAVRSQTETPNRYRYTGKERDEENGFYYHGARYYAPWLGRWIAFDPALLVDRGASPPSRNDESGANDGNGESETGEMGANPGQSGQDDEQEDSETETESASSEMDDSENPARGNRAGIVEVNGYCYTLNNPILYQDPDGWAPVIGHIYVVRGTLAGQKVTYVGSTAQDLLKRVGSKHKWNLLVKAKSTTVTTYEVRAKLNVGASNRGTLLSARAEALRSGEQKVLSQIKKGKAVNLNEIRAAGPQNTQTWRQRHSVRLGRPKLTLKGGVKVGGFAGFVLLDIFNMYRQQKLSRYGYGLYVLQDAGGTFTLAQKREHWFAHHYRWKIYRSGPMAGQKVEIGEKEFDFWKKEGELLWGTTDFWGDFVPGLLRPRLPVVKQTGGGMTA